MYITKANFKRIIKEIDVPQDYKFEDLVLWKVPDGKEYKGDRRSIELYMTNKTRSCRLTAFLFTLIPRQRLQRL